MSMPKPMDPERLAEYREAIERAQHPDPRARSFPIYGWTDASNLLADRDHHAQRADEARRILAEIADVLTVDLHWPPESLGATARIVDSLAAEYGKAEAEVARLRARVRVEAEDVERAGVTHGHVEAWLLANGWSAEQGDLGRRVWTRGGSWVGIEPDAEAKQLAVIIRYIARGHKRQGLDILDEMAAMDVT